MLEVVRCVIESHGKQLTAEAATAALGMRPAEAWEAVARQLGIERSGAELYEQSEPLLRDRCVWVCCGACGGALLGALDGARRANAGSPTRLAPSGVVGLPTILDPLPPTCPPAAQLA